VEASSDSNINTLCFAGSGAADFALAVLCAQLDPKDVDAHISGSANITTSGDVTLGADDARRSRLFRAGAGSGFVAGGAALAYNEIHNTITGYIDGSTVTSTAGSIASSATSDATIKSLARACGVWAVGVAGSAAVNLIGNTVTDYINARRHADRNITCWPTRQRHRLAGGTISAGVRWASRHRRREQTDNITKAYIGGDSNVNAKGNGAAATIKTGPTTPTAQNRPKPFMAWRSSPTIRKS